MRKHLLVAGLAIATLIPTFAAAQQTCQERKSNRVAGTVVGAGLGALLGSAIAGNSSNTGGTIAGGVAGALIGNQVSKGNGDCTQAYGYYDNNGAWHSNRVSQNNARGYYDRNGNWISGAPSGVYYSNGQWVANNANGYGYNAAYTSADAPRDPRQRIAWLDERVRQGINDRSLSRREANRAMQDLDSIRRDDRAWRNRHGELSANEEANLQARLDTLSSEIRWSRQN